MRRSIVASVLIGALLAPVAGAFELGAYKTVEQPLEPGADVAFEMPLHFDRDGHFYAKLLPTSDNAVNDGTRANGSLSPPSGWAVSYALVREDGTREELGTFVDSTLSSVVPVRAEERPTFVATVRVPADAERGGPRQAVYVALAFRETAEGAAPGSASGAKMDEARAITLLLTDALVPPPAGEEEEPGPVSPLPPSVTQRDQEAQIVVQQSLPTWFLVAALVLAAAFLAVLVVRTFQRRRS